MLLIGHHCQSSTISFTMHSSADPHNVLAKHVHQLISSSFLYLCLKWGRCHLIDCNIEINDTRTTSLTESRQPNMHTQLLDSTRAEGRRSMPPKMQFSVMQATSKIPMKQYAIATLQPNPKDHQSLHNSYIMKVHEVWPVGQPFQGLVASLHSDVLVVQLQYDSVAIGESSWISNEQMTMRFQPQMVHLANVVPLLAWWGAPKIILKWKIEVCRGPESQKWERPKTCT